MFKSRIGCVYLLCGPLCTTGPVCMCRQMCSPQLLIYVSKVLILSFDSCANFWSLCGPVCMCRQMCSNQLRWLSAHPAATGIHCTVTLFHHQHYHHHHLQHRHYFQNRLIPSSNNYHNYSIFSYCSTFLSSLQPWHLKLYLEECSILHNCITSNL